MSICPAEGGAADTIHRSVARRCGATGSGIQSTAAIPMPPQLQAPDSWPTNSVSAISVGRDPPSLGGDLSNRSPNGRHTVAMAGFTLGLGYVVSPAPTHAGSHPTVTSAAVIGGEFATAQCNSRPRNLPHPILFWMIWQTMAVARDQSVSDGSSGVAIVASESPEVRTVM
jgi:hypothetical protein